MVSNRACDVQAQPSLAQSLPFPSLLQSLPFIPVPTILSLQNTLSGK